jgi:hypothetical protein
MSGRLHLVTSPIGKVTPNDSKQNALSCFFLSGEGESGMNDWGW